MKDSGGVDLARLRTLSRTGQGKLPSVAEDLFSKGFAFDFFQAIRLLERLQPDRSAITRTSFPKKEIVRFQARQSFDFPPSSIYDLKPAGESSELPQMIIAFMGLTGPSGVLPRFYTELLMNIPRDAKHQERYALRDWFDMFNHRFISLLYRSWEKYRFWMAYERGEYAETEPDTFTQALFSQIGLGLPSLRHRLQVCKEEPSGQRSTLAKIDDLGLLQFGGYFGHRPRCAISLQALLSKYLRTPVAVEQFQGQWLQLEPDNQTSLGALGGCNSMGVNALIGDRVWDVRSKIRVRIGPLTFQQFIEFIPDPSPVSERKALFLLAQLVRLYVGLEIDVDVQLIVLAAEVPMCRMGSGGGPIGSRIGWNCWSHTKPLTHDADEPVFAAPEGVTIQVQRGA